MRSSIVLLAVALVLVPSTAIPLPNAANDTVGSNATKSAAPASHFSYESTSDNGPQHWGNQCQDVGTQSPIDIVYDHAVYDKHIQNLIFSNYNSGKVQLSYVLENTGHNAKISVKSDVLPIIRGGGLHRDYQLAQFHFHWGENNSYGSEHTLNGRSFPLELHFVHTAMGDNVPENEKLAVLGVMFAISSKKNPLLEPIISNLHNIVKTGNTVALKNLKLTDLLPHRYDRYFRYAGSLTTPPCSEQVVWTVFHDTLSISSVQLAEFRKLLDAEDEPIKFNNRPRQAIGKRPISSSFNVNKIEKN